MKSYEEIVALFDSDIPRDVISVREGGAGKKLSYLEGWYIIDRLNKVLGQGNWAYSADLTPVHQGSYEDKYGKPVHSVHYLAKVRLVTALGAVSTEFTDVGYGDGTDKTNIGKAHELAAKEAVTDGLKRCARCLGNSMGNGLYDKSGEGIESVEAKAPMEKKASVDDRASILADITAASAIAIGKRVITREALIKKLKDDYKVAAKEALTLEQAKRFSAELQKLISFQLTS